MPAKEVHELGLQRDRSPRRRRCKTIAERSFQRPMSRRCSRRLRTDRRYMFKSRAGADRLHARRRSRRAKAAAPELVRAAAEGRRAHSSRIRRIARRTRRTNTTRRPRTAAARRSSTSAPIRPRRRASAGTESTAFHETIPGHHLQIAIALERKEIHPIGRYICNSGYVGRVGAVCRASSRTR